jgi:hypothetical protein
MRDIGSTRLPKPHHDLEEGEVSPFFRRDGGKFRRSPEEHRDARCDRRSAAGVTFPI